MAFPVTLNGTTYTLADFEGLNYVQGFPDALEDFVTHAGAIYNSTSASSVTIGTGSKTFTTADSGKPYVVGTPLRCVSRADTANFMDGTVTSYSGTTLVINVLNTGGSGAHSDWNITIGGGTASVTIDGGTFTGDLNVTGAITSTQVDITGQGDLRLQDSTGGEYVGLQAPATVGSSFTLTLPSADGSANQALVTNGSGTLSFAAVGSSVDYQEFTSSGTFTKASGVNYIYVEAIGGGGSGASGNFSGDGAQGGGGGAFVSGLFRASEVGATETVTIGAGGTTVTAGSGNNGGATSFGSLLSAKGGLGGLKNNTAGRGTPYRIGGDTSGFNIDNTSMAVAPSYAGLGGLASYKGGDTIYGGGGGGGAKNTSNVGGSSVFGGSGGTSGIGTAGSNGSAPGGGGGASDNSASGEGAVGRLRVWSW